MLRYFTKDMFDDLNKAIEKYSDELDSYNNFTSLLESDTAEEFIKYFLDLIKSKHVGLGIMYNMDKVVPELPNVLIIPAGDRFIKFYHTYTVKISELYRMANLGNPLQSVDTYSPSQHDIDTLKDLLIPLLFGSDEDY